jgi:radical SAM superfamily enzyme YgiQ (UPF0313 family)
MLMIRTTWMFAEHGGRTMTVRSQVSPSHVARQSIRLVLLSPKGPLYRHRGGIFRKSLRYQPLTLTTLASLVPPNLNVQIELRDEGIQEIALDIEADLIGMTVITGTAKRAYELSAHFRHRGISVVLGGPHVTLLPDEAQKHADAICVGYAEQSWPRLLRDFAAGRMASRYEQGPDFSLDNLPFPRRDLFERRHFLTQSVFEATRSCAHDCEFCVAPSAWGRKQYQKPIAHVIEDIRGEGGRKIIFVDLNLISDTDYAARLFEALIPLRVNWFGLSTVLVAHDRLLMQLMARSGCKGLLLGFETISPDNLSGANKRFNSPDQYSALVAELHDLGIAVQGCFVFGLDHDTPEVFDRIARFVVDVGIDLPRFAVLTPFPGTPMFRKLDAESRILTRDWEHYDGQHVVFQPKHMSVTELQAGHERAWKYAYRYRSMARRLLRSRTQLPLGIMANLGYRFYAHRLHQFYTCDWPINQAAPA